MPDGSDAIKAEASTSDARRIVDRFPSLNPYNEKLFQALPFGCFWRRTITLTAGKRQVHGYGHYCSKRYSVFYLRHIFKVELSKLVSTDSAVTIAQKKDVIRVRSYHCGEKRRLAENSRSRPLPRVPAEPTGFELPVMRHRAITTPQRNDGASEARPR